MDLFLTPNTITDNLFLNFGNIIDDAILGYRKFYMMEQEFISNIEKTEDILLNSPEMNIYIAYANIIQYGKSYFLKEIVNNTYMRIFFEKYMEQIGTKIPFTSPTEYKSATIEELEEGQDGGQKGGGLITFFLLACTTISITNLNSITSIATSLSTFAQTSIAVNIDRPINFETGQIPLAIGYQGTLNPLDEEDIAKFTQQYTTDTLPVNKVIDVNFNELFKSGTMEKMRKMMPVLQSMITSDQELYKMYVEIIQSEIERINMLTSVAHISLEEMCRNFVETTDRDLPLPLFKLLNSKMFARLAELQQKSQNLRVEKEKELTTKMLIEKGVPENVKEPGLSEAIYSDVTKKVSYMFNWPSSKSSTKSLDLTDGQDEPTVEQLTNVYDDVEKAVAKEISELSQDIDLQAFNDVTQSVLFELGLEAEAEQQKTNLRLYLKAICQIKRPIYVFNETSGLLYIKDPARSRSHLKILAENVVKYHDKIIGGLTYQQDGDIKTEIPNETRQTRLKSLREKSIIIGDILTEYDIRLVNTLTGDNSVSSKENINKYIEAIVSMWINIRDSTKEALRPFPVSEKEIKQKEKAEQEKLELEMFQKMEEHKRDMQERFQDLMQNIEQNNMTQQEWSALNEWFAITGKGATGAVSDTVAEMINVVVNSTADIGDNTLERTKGLIDRGSAGLMSIAWAIAISGIILLIPLLGYSAWRTGFISALFTRAKKQLDNEEKQPSVAATQTVPNPNPQYFAPYQDNRLTNDPRSFWDDFRQEFGDNEARDMLNTLRDLPRGGRRYNRKIRNRKTRKQQKRKTRKLKYGKRHFTRHKKRGLTKRR